MTRILVAFVFVFFATGSMANDWLIVANKRFIVDTVSKEQLNRIYEGRQLKLYDNLVVPIQQPANSEAFKVFSENVLGKRPYLAIQHLMRKFLSGKGLAPRVLSNDYEVVEWLKGHTDSIGYIKRSSMIETLKPIYTIK